MSDGIAYEEWKKKLNKHDENERRKYDEGERRFFSPTTEIVTYSRLSPSLKVLVVLGWIATGFFCLFFLIGIIIGMLSGATA
jgi:hypothetical protein